MAIDYSKTQSILKDELIDYGAAVEFVASHADAAAFAFFPSHRNGKVVGGTVFAITSQTEEVSDEHWTLETFGGLFHSSSGEEDTLWPEDLEELDFQGIYGVDFRRLRYKIVVRGLVSRASSMETQCSLGILHQYDGDIELNPAFGLCVPDDWEKWLSMHLPVN
ncbi:hypothetical protein [Chromobacterium subtsugae]|uniref:hypothetical protein n=1 Tax=Chromobacterium subtsugae TaxID=251747 RepID=UPI0012FFC7B0|nr:hypothetical protein [Chromobacterium subtsugae]